MVKTVRGLIRQLENYFLLTADCLSICVPNEPH